MTTTPNPDSSAVAPRADGSVAQTDRGWRGVAAEHRGDELTAEVSGLLQARSRRLLGDLLRPHKKWLWVLLGICDGAAPFVGAAESVLVGRSRERDFAELPAVLGARYGAALRRGRATVVAAGRDGVLAATLSLLDEAA